MSETIQTLGAWLGGHPQWVGLAIFLVAALECLAVAGLLVPGTLALFSLAMLAGSGTLGLGPTLLLGFLGGLCGDALSYALGRRFHQNIRHLPLLRSHPQWLAGAESQFRRYGSASLLVGRFIGPLRPMLPLIAGMLDMPLRRFVPVTLLAAAGWSVAYLAPGWATGAALRLPLPMDFWVQAGVVALALLAPFALAMRLSLQRQRRAVALSALSAVLLFVALLLGLPHLEAFDHGLLDLVQQARSERTDKWMVLVTRFGDFRTQLYAGVLLCGLLLVTRQWRALRFAIATLLGTALLDGLLKHAFARTRPELLLEPLHTFSFPSGHASASFAFFLCLATLAGRGQPPRLRLTWLLLGGLPALTISASRVYLGAHWPTDVLGGALLATAVCAASLWLSERHAPLPALPLRVWQLILPACAALLMTAATWGLPQAVEMYRY